MKKVILALVLAMLPFTAQGETFTASKDRTVYLKGQVGRNALSAAQRIEELSKRSTDDIDIIISSPGGYIAPGLQMIQAMNIAQERGVKIRCLVTMMAASMAFQVLAECDERYTLKYSMLLWHPARTGFRGPVKWTKLLYQGKRLRTLEKILVKRLLEKMDIPYKFFKYHFYHETMWNALTLKEHTPDFFNIVDNIENVHNPFTMGR